MDKRCGVCGASFEAKRRTAKYCCGRCRKRAQRIDVNAAPDRPTQARDEPSTQADAGSDSLESAALSELEAAGRASSAAGRTVLALARRIDGGGQETGASFASLVKEFRASLAQALKGAEQASDPVDELRERRERKRTG